MQCYLLFKVPTVETGREIALAMTHSCRKSRPGYFSNLLELPYGYASRPGVASVIVQIMIVKNTALCVALLVAVLLSGCSADLRFMPSEADRLGPVAWHAEQERSCLASGQVRENQFIRARTSIGSPAGCGAERPFIVTAALGGSIALKPAATLRCPMIAPVERWLQDVVQPAAQRYLGEQVVGLKVAASYGCRRRNNKPGGKLSEHGRANALDISAFYLANGGTVSVKQDWRNFNRDGNSRFLRTVHKGACHYFSTVLGPDADAYHRDHFHLDLARHGRDGKHRVCS